MNSWKAKILVSGYKDQKRKLKKVRTLRTEKRAYRREAMACEESGITIYTKFYNR